MNDAITRLAAGAAGASSLSELGARTLAPLKEITGAGHALLYAYDERGMVGLEGDVWIPDSYRPYWAEDPTQAETRRLGPGPRVALADRLVGRNRLRRSRAWLEFYEPCEIDHMCCVFLTSVPHGSPGMTNLFLARGPKQEPYQKRDVLLLRHVLPVLSAAVHRLRRAPPDLEQQGEQALLDWGRQQAFLVAAVDGRIDWISPAARPLFGESLPARLPGFLVDGIGPRGGRTPWAHWRLVDGRLLRVDISTIPGCARVVVLLSAAASTEDRHALTPGERNVMECLAAGSSTLEIATTLSLSEATVRTHLRNIYAKLRVHSRTEAVLQWLEGCDHTPRRAGEPSG